jgi:hypothetical protein
LVNKKTGILSRTGCFIAAVLLLGVVLAAGQYPAPARASDESSVDAEVSVVSSVAESYGAGVAASHRVLLPWRALGEPDASGAWLYSKGWISIELDGAVAGCAEISIWGSGVGWGASLFKVYASSDGSTWTRIGGGKCKSGSYVQYDFRGDFAGVRYIKVARSGSRWSVLLLDAVRAKGGD